MCDNSVKNMKQVHVRISKKTLTRLEKLFESNNWDLAGDLLSSLISRVPNDHWLLTRFGATLYERRRYREAQQVIAQAWSLEPNCPLVRWDFAGVNYALGQKHDAIGEWRSLVHIGPHKLARRKCGEGLPWARGLVSSCCARLAKHEAESGNREEALQWFRKYCELLQQGTKPPYDPELVCEWLLPVLGQKS